jgi:hypothetical protein
LFRKSEWTAWGCPRTSSTRAPLEVVGAITKAGFKDVLIARPELHAPWNVVVATR